LRTRLDQELELATRIVEPDRRQLCLPEGHPCDRQRVTGIALAGTSRPEPLPVAELGRDLDRGHPCSHQEARRGSAIPGRALEPDPVELTQPNEPAQQHVEPGRIVRIRPFIKHLPDVVDGARRQRQLVGIDADHAHLVASLDAGTMGVGQVRQMCVEVTATLL
jgi:hypothetical protein